MDTLSKGLDKLVYTSEEKADMAFEVRKYAGELLVGWMGATQGQNIARRLLAIVVTFTWLFMYVVSAGLNIAVSWIENPVLVKNIQASADIVGTRASEMNGAMMLILGFILRHRT